MNEEIQAALTANTSALLEALGAFTPQQFNMRTEPGKWTAGQVAEHIHKAERAIPSVLRGEYTSADRVIDEKLPIIKTVFLDFSKKLNSPEFIIPTEGEKDKETLYSAIEKNRMELLGLLAEKDLSLIYTGFNLPRIGTLTGYELINFLMCHGERHIFQLKNLYKSIAEKV